MVFFFFGFFFWKRQLFKPRIIFFQNNSSVPKPEPSGGSSANITMSGDLGGGADTSDSSSLVDWQLMTARAREAVPALSPDSTTSSD